MIHSQVCLVGRRYAGLAWFHAGVQASDRLPNQALPQLLDHWVVHDSNQT